MCAYISCIKLVNNICIMVIYSTPSVDVRLVSDEEIILISWKQKPETDHFKEVYIKVLQFATSIHPTILFCTDLSLIGSLKNEQEAWLNTEYYQQVFNGINSDIYTAVVFSDDHFNAIITNYRAIESETLHSFIHFNYFTELMEAYYWLVSIKKGQDVMVLPQNIA